MSQQPQPEPSRSFAPLGLFYGCVYASVGITLPYLPKHLRSLGLSGADVGLLMASFPLMQILAPPLAGFLADRTRRGALLLSVLASGYAICFAPLLVATGCGGIAPWLLGAAFCSAPLSMLADSLTLERLGPRSALYPRIRLWGSVGFVVTALGFGALWTGERTSPPAVVVAALACGALAFGASLLVRGRGGAGDVRLSEAPGLLRDRRLQLLALATGLHWIAFAPHNLLFTVYLDGLGLSPRVAGLGFAAGVAAEVAVMALFPRFGVRFAPRQVLAAAFGLSIARWALTAIVRGAVPMVALQLLHGVCFGAFMVAGVAMVKDLAPARLRATALALFVAATYGVGGLVGYVAVGRLYDLVPAPLLFWGAAALETVPFALAALALPGPGKADAGVLGSPEVTP